MKKTIKDFKLNGKKTIIRCDLNVPIKNGAIDNDNRIVMSIETIKHAMANNAKVILMSHLGRVKSEEDKATNSLKVVAIRLSELLNKEVKFCPLTRGVLLEQMVSELQNGEVMLIENTRFEDIDGKKESGNDLELAKYWASLGDIFINDAYGSSHRAHASTVGIPSILPSGIGFLVEKELIALEDIVNNHKSPFIVILGGAKVADKIGVIKNLIPKADKILIGGGMVYTFLKAMGHEIGKSLLDESSVEFCKKMLEEHADKIVLPVDVAVGLEYNPDTPIRTATISEIKSNEMGMDIGVQTTALFKRYLINAHTVIWNGPVGVFEFPKFNVGTRKICEILSNSKAKVLIGGGDSASAVIKFGYQDKFYHISTGGGATLEFLEGKELPGINAIENR